MISGFKNIKIGDNFDWAQQRMIKIQAHTK